jgi:hypothetical protein
MVNRGRNNTRTRHTTPSNGTRRTTRASSTQRNRPPPIRRRPAVNVGQATRRTISNRDLNKNKAKEYVNEIKALRATLKEIQKKFRVANSKVPKDIVGMRRAKSERMAIAVFPPLPPDEVGKYFKASQRWGIVATARLWWRNLSTKRRPHEIVDKINAATSYTEFKSIIHWLSTHRVAEPLITEDGLEVVYRQESGPLSRAAHPPRYSSSSSDSSSDSDSSLVYGFPAEYVQGILPGYSPPPGYSPRSSPPVYTRGGSKKKYKHRTKKTKHF